MSVTWTLKYNGETRSLNGWGITSRELKFVSLDVSQLTFTIKLASLNAGAPFPYGATIDLYRDGVRWFSGTVTQLSSEGTAQEDVINYTISNLWWQLENIVFQDFMNTPVDHTNPASPLTPGYVSYTVLFQDQSGNARKIDAQITVVLNYAKSKGAALLIGTIDPSIYVPMEEAHDMTCADVIRHALRWQPDVTSNIDYSTNPPTLNFKNRVNAPVVSFDLNAGSLITRPQITPRYDLQPPGLKIYFQHTVSYGDGTARSYYEIQTAGTVTDGIGSIVMTIPLNGNGSAEEPVPPSLATNLYNSLTVLHFEGDIEMKEIECSGIIRPGVAINLTNGDPSWATMKALVQSVTETEYGKTVAHVGPPTQLSVQDLLTLNAVAQKMAQSKGLVASRATAGALIASALISEGIALQVCEDGNPKTIYVRAAGTSP